MDDLELSGFDELIKKINTLSEDLPVASGRKALRDGAKVLQKELLANVPVDSGETKAAIKVRAGKRKKDYIGVLTGLLDGFFNGEVFYAGFNEYGYKTAKGKKIPGKHWAKKSYEATEAAILERISQTLTEEVLKELEDK
jgi:HK97 gp10 family phage protein